MLSQIAIGVTIKLCEKCDWLSGKIIYCQGNSGNSSQGNCHLIGEGRCSRRIGILQLVEEVKESLGREKYWSKKGT